MQAPKPRCNTRHIDAVVNDPKVVEAEEALRMHVNAPSIVPERPSKTMTLPLPECQKPMSLTRVLPTVNRPSQLSTFFCKACQFVTAVKLEK